MKTDNNKTADSKEKIKEITDKLEQGVKDVFESEKYKEYLTVMSKFYHYSYRNSLLIAMQKPGATYVAGFASWQKNFKRNVMKGEQGIKILAPTPYKVKKNLQKLDSITSMPIIDADGKPITEEQEIIIPAFRVVSVFDVSQTEGKELPKIVNVLTDNVEMYKEFFSALERTSPVPIFFEQINNGVRGYYDNIEKRIALAKGNSELQTLKTLIHEIAHAILHDIDLDIPLSEQPERPDEHSREVQAESIAYVVCQHYGLDTSEYSFAYIAGWSENKEIKELANSLETISQTSATLINTIDTHLKELQKEKFIEYEKTTIATNLNHGQPSQLTNDTASILQNLINKDVAIFGKPSNNVKEIILEQGYTYHNGYLKKLPQELIDSLPDPTITIEQMHDYGYGYDWDGMLPLREDMAIKLYTEDDIQIFRLYEDNTEGAIEDITEFAPHAHDGGVFGIEKEHWHDLIEYNFLQQELSQSESMKEALSLYGNDTIENKKCEVPELKEHLKKITKLHCSDSLFKNTKKIMLTQKEER